MNLVKGREQDVAVWLRKVICMTCLCSAPGWLLAQEQDTPDAVAVSTEDETVEIVEPPDRSRILYLDVPLAVEPGVDPVFPNEFEPESLAVDGDPQQRVQVMRSYDSAIATIEDDGGAWAQALTEELSALGSLQQAQGDHNAAIDTLSRALQVNRINEGLYTLSQVPLVERMIDSYEALGDWGNVDLYENYLFFVQQKAYGSDDPRLIPVLHELGIWNLEAFSLGFGDPLGGRLSTAQLLFNAATRMVGMHFGRNDERYIVNLRSIARSAYLVSMHPETLSEIGRPEFRNAQDNLRDQLKHSDPFEISGFRAGRDSLQEIVDIYRERGDSPYKLAEALANLADWELMFSRTRTAEELYAEAWQVLAESENSEELIARLFGQVIPIPTFASLPTNLLLGSSDSMNRPTLHHDYADIRFAVTQNGATRDVEILTEETTDNARQLARLRREVLRSTFRPLIIDGKRVESEGHLFRYRYWY